MSEWEAWVVVWRRFWALFRRTPRHCHHCLGPLRTKVVGSQVGLVYTDECAEQCRIMAAIQQMASR